MHILQFCNVYTQEIFRDQKYEKPDVILEMLESAEKKKGHQWFIFDYEFRTLSAYYVYHSIHHEGNNTIYKLFFKTKLHDKQVPIM